MKKSLTLHGYSIDDSMDDQMLLYKNKDGAHIYTLKEFKAIGYSNESKEKAMDDLIKDLEIFFRYHLEKGTLKQSLKNFGWTYEAQ